MRSSYVRYFFLTFTAVLISAQCLREKGDYKVGASNSTQLGKTPLI